MSINLGRKHNNSKASLEQRVNDLERRLSRMMSVQALPIIGTIMAQQDAHGFGVRDVVVKASDGIWKQFDPFAFFQAFDEDPTSVGAIVGVIENVVSVDLVVVRLSGEAKIGEFLNLDWNEVPLPGAKLYAQEIQYGAFNIFAGTMTHIPQPSGVVVGFVLEAGKMIVCPHRDSDATVVLLPVAVSGATLVPLSIIGGVADYAVDEDVGTDPDAIVGVGYLGDGTNVLTAIAGTIRTDAYGAWTTWSDGYQWLLGTGGTSPTKPIIPATEEWRPTVIARLINNRLTVYKGQSTDGVGDLWDVDLSTPPASDDTLKWDDTDKRWKPGPGGLAGNADGPSVIARQVAGVGPVTAFMTTANEQVLFRSGGILQWDKIGVAQLKNTPAYTVLANGTSATAALTELAAIDGTILGRVGTELKFGSNPQLGTAADGLGYLKIHFAVGKYWEIDATGKMTVYQTATSKVEILADSSIKFTWGSSNTLTIDPADIVGSSRVFRIREIDVCDSSGVAKKMQGIFTDLY
jgi:hypothetical protein